MATASIKFRFMSTDPPWVASTGLDMCLPGETFGSLDCMPSESGITLNCVVAGNITTIDCVP